MKKYWWLWALGGGALLASLFWKDSKGDTVINKVTKQFVLAADLIGRLNQYLPVFKNAASKWNVPLADLIGIAWQESGINPQPKDNINSPTSIDKGMMQINSKAHAPWMATHDPYDPSQAIDYAAQVLAQAYNSLKPLGLTGDALRKAAISAYNTGAGNVTKSLNAGLDSDHTTFGGNYGASVIARAAKVAAAVLS